MLVRTTFELPDPEDDSLGVNASGGDDGGRNPILNVLAVLFIKGKVVLTGVGFKQITARLGLGRIVALYYVLILFIPDSLIYSVPLFLKQQCDRTLGPPQLRALLHRDLDQAVHRHAQPRAALAFCAVVGCHSLGICTLNLLPLLSCSATMTVSTLARH
jgi:hypothetical protein